VSEGSFTIRRLLLEHAARLHRVTVVLHWRWFAVVMYVCFISCCMELVLTFIDYPRTLLMARFDIRTVLMRNCSLAHSMLCSRHRMVRHPRDTFTTLKIFECVI